MDNDNSAITVPITAIAFANPLILDSIFKHLSLSSLCSCRLVNKLWLSTATTAIRKSLKTRLLLCADPKCATELDKFLSVFQDAPLAIPYSRAILILDHLPLLPSSKRSKLEGEIELLFQLSQLFKEEQEHHHHLRENSSTSTTLSPSSSATEPYANSFFDDSLPTTRGRNGEIVKTACEKFSSFIENLIVNLTLHQQVNNPENIEYWLKQISFPNLVELTFHITRTSPENISDESLQIFLNSLCNLKSVGVRKLTKKGDRLLIGIFEALTKKSHLGRLKNLSIEVFTDDKLHLEILINTHLFLENLSMIYLGGEVRFIEKMELIRKLLSNVSGTLQHFYTHLPLFSLDPRDKFPKMVYLKTLKIEKVYREFSITQAQLFAFDFHYYFPNIERITFKDYDLWKNMQLKTFPVDEVSPCPEIKCISLPDLCFDAPLMERYFMKFPHLRSLSIIVSYLSRYQRQCSFCLVYAFLPQLKELNAYVFEMDLAIYDHIFTGIPEETCSKLQEDDRKAQVADRGLSIIMLEDLETLRITSLHGKKVLGITDQSVDFAFLEMPSLRYFTIGSSLISSSAIAKMTTKFDVVVQSCSSTKVSANSRQKV